MNQLMWVTARATFVVACLGLFKASAKIKQSQISKSDINQIYERAVAADDVRSDTLIQLGKKLLLSSENLGYSEGIVKANILIGRGFMTRPQLDSSCAPLLRAIALAETIQPLSLDEGIARQLFGMTLAQLKDQEGVIWQVEKAVEIFKKHLNRQRFVSASLTLASAYVNVGDFAKALEHLFSAREIAGEPGITARDRTAVDLAIANVYAAMGSLRESLSFAFSALKTAEQANQKSEACRSFNTIAKIYDNAGLYDSALLYYRISLANAAQGEPAFEPFVAQAVQDIAAIYTKQGRFADAVQTVHKVLRTNARAEPYRREILFNILAEAYFRLERYDSARYNSHLAIHYGKLGDDRVPVRDSYRRLQLLYSMQHRFDSAYYYQEKHYAYNDSIYSELARQNLDDYRIQLAAMEQQREIESLRKEAGLQAAERKLLILYFIFAGVAAAFATVALILFFRNKQKREQIRAMSLKKELDQRTFELQHHALRIISVNNAVSELEDKVKKIKQDDQQGASMLKSVLSALHGNKALDREWETFNRYFTGVHQGFYEALERQFPSLSIAEKRLAALVRVGMTNREIAAILNIEDASVKMAKYRLKKKLKLSDEQQLATFLMELQQSSSTTN